MSTCGPWIRRSRPNCRCCSTSSASPRPMRPTLADQLASRLLGDDETVAPLLPLIADRARGNPLFIEELVRKFEEGGNLTGERGAYRLVQAPDPHLVPETVQAIIAARIDAR